MTSEILFSRFDKYDASSGEVNLSFFGITMSSFLLTFPYFPNDASWQVKLCPSPQIHLVCVKTNLKTLTKASSQNCVERCLCLCFYHLHLCSFYSSWDSFSNFKYMVVFFFVLLYHVCLYQKNIMYYVCSFYVCCPHPSFRIQKSL